MTMNADQIFELHARINQLDRTVKMLSTDEPLETLTERVVELEQIIREMSSGNDNADVREMCSVWKFSMTETRLFLALKSNRPVSKEFLMRAVYADKYWSVEEYPAIKVLDVMVAKMRMKMKIAEAPVHIHTVWGQGWQVIGGAA